MSQVINTNMASLSAQRALGNSQGDVTTSLQRLSSGLRINSAKDDAAGLAISERFNSQIKGLNQAVRNANDAVSLSQTAESALAETTGLLQRARELSVQAANATNSSSDRTALQAEVTQIIQEIDRIADTTEFNGIKLLNGTFTSQQFQVGANANQTVGISLTSAGATDLGSAQAVGFTSFEAVVIGAAAATPNSARIAENLTFTVTPAGGSATATQVAIAADAESNEVADSINAAVAGITASATTGVSIGAFAGASGEAFTMEINGVSLGSITSGANAAATATLVSDAISAKSELAGLTVDNSTSGVVKLRDASGKDISVDITATGLGADSDITVTALDASGSTVGSAVNIGSQSALVGTTVSGDITFTTSLATGATFALQSDDTSAGSVLDAGSDDTDVAGAVTASTDKVSTIDISTVAGAQLAISVLDTAISTVSTSRANVGALQNRFDSVVSSLQASAENQSGARSRIVDADFAAETAALTRGQILQQAGIAVLAQANAAPQNVLALLQ